MIDTLNALAADIHATATEKGWWDRDAGTDALIVLDESLELQREFAHGIGHHESTQCPGYRNDEIECADVIIAALSLARQQGWNIGGAVLAKAEFNKTR